MITGRVHPRHLRLVVATEEPFGPAGSSDQLEPAQTEVDRVIRPIVEAGRGIIAAGVAAVMNKSIVFGFDWDRDELRSAIADFVGRKLHDDVLAQCGHQGIDPDAAARCLIRGHERGALADAITNSIMQDIARALVQYGCPGGLGDSRPLRASVQEIVDRNIRCRRDD